MRPHPLAAVKPTSQKNPAPVRALFIDIGGVLLTNGWDHHARRSAAKNFGLKANEFEERHRLVFETYEAGKMTLEEYLKRVVFSEPRSFTAARFRDFLFAQTKPHVEMIELVRGIKVRHGLKIFVVSNEGRELNDYRIKKYGLSQWVDCFVSSCFVHLRKPDADIFRLALDLAQVPARQIVYIDDRALFVQIAEELGMRGIHHTDERSTAEKLAALGLCGD